MIENYNKLPLPFYDTVEKQVYKRVGSFGDSITAQLVNPKNIILPFQIKRQNRYNEVSTFELYDKDGVLLLDLTTVSPSGNLYIKTLTGSGFDYICYENFSELTSDLDCGQCYIKLSDGVQTWYSELITVYDWTYDFSGDVELGEGTAIEINPSDIIGWTT